MQVEIDGSRIRTVTFLHLSFFAAKHATGTIAWSLVSG
jgi:hypothetical protein